MGIYLFKSGDQVLLDPTLFEPVEGKIIYDIPCKTVRPATHVALLTFRSLRPKDIVARKLLERVLPDEDRALLKTMPYRRFEAMLSNW